MLEPPHPDHSFPAIPTSLALLAISLGTWSGGIFLFRVLYFAPDSKVKLLQQLTSNQQSRGETPVGHGREKTRHRCSRRSKPSS
jgi:hypothetical protein